MTRTYLNAVSELQSKYPGVNIDDKKGANLKAKTRYYKNHAYKRLGSITVNHSKDLLSRGGKIALTVGIILSAILIVPIFIRSYRKLVVTLWTEAKSGREKISVYILQQIAKPSTPSKKIPHVLNSNPIQTHKKTENKSSIPKPRSEAPIPKRLPLTSDEPPQKLKAPLPEGVSLTTDVPNLEKSEASKPSGLRPVRKGPQPQIENIPKIESRLARKLLQKLWYRMNQSFFDENINILVSQKLSSIFRLASENPTQLNPQVVEKILKSDLRSVPDGSEMDEYFRKNHRKVINLLNRAEKEIISRG